MLKVKIFILERKVCAKAYGGIWGRVYAPDRILYPLKRVGDREEAEFVRCSWDEIIDAFSKKFKEYIDESTQKPSRYGGAALSRWTICISCTTFPE